MNLEGMSTKEKILYVAVDLVAEHGFKETTVKDIAQFAGISEMTVFRHFGSKVAILEEAMRNYSFVYPINNEILDKLTWDLEADLLLIARMYYKFNKKNEKVLLIKFKEGQKLFNIDISESPRKLKEFLHEYFDKMHAMGKIVSTNNEALALNFMNYNFGNFCGNLISGIGIVTEITKLEAIEYGVRIFARGLRP
ncbi:MAG: TetR family transcriptional regulator [Firmicutes bacterium]|nr:TetR family transcriptional regulator [Bacillota bacterium]